MPLLGALLLAGALNGGYYPYGGRRRTVTRTKTTVVNRSKGRPVRTVTKRTTTSRGGRDLYYLNGGFFRF